MLCLVHGKLQVRVNGNVSRWREALMKRTSAVRGLGVALFHIFIYDLEEGGNHTLIKT